MAAIRCELPGRRWGEPGVSEQRRAAEDGVTSRGRGAIWGQQAFTGGWKGPSQRVVSDPGGRVKMALQAPHLLGIICQGLALSWVRCATPLTCELEGNKKPCAEMTQRLFVF